MFSSHLFRAPLGVPCFLLLLTLVISGSAFAGALVATDIDTRDVLGSDFRATHEALVEAIEAEGLVVGAVMPFKEMLVRTDASRGEVAMPFAEAEIVQFCSSGLAWQLVGEQASQLALCPMSIAIHSGIDDPGRITLSWRSPGRSTPGRSKVDALLRRLVDRAAELARLRW